MPKLIHDPNPKRVRDSQGREWEYTPDEVQTEEYDHHDYQGPPVKMTREFIMTPHGKVVISQKARSR